MDITSRQRQIIISLLAGNSSLQLLLTRPEFSEVTERTLQRDLSELVEKGLVSKMGEARASTYSIPNIARVHIELPEKELEALFSNESRPLVPYDFERLNILKESSLFTPEESKILEEYNALFVSKLRTAPADIIRRERERITIELSWKSSQIEGNTYTLLETESLLKEGVAAPGRSQEETTMVLNHKKALTFSEENHALFAGKISPQLIIELHKILAEGLVSHGIRENQVGITGSAYRPLDNKFQIHDELERFCEVLNFKENVFEKALLAFTYICYLQPFNDVNKRTARILANAILYAHDSFPLSLRAVEINVYKLAILSFYELGSLGNAKKIFIDQGKYATENYAI